MSSWDVVLLDADDTLFDFHRAETWALEETLAPFGVPGPVHRYIELFREVNTAAWKSYEAGLLSSSEVRLRRFVEFLERLPAWRGGAGVPVLDPRLVSDRYVSFLARADFLFPGARDLLERIAGRYPVALVTNGLSEVQNSRLDRAGIRHLFGAVVISEEVGAQKPDPAVFRIALDRLGAGERAVMVGDNLHSDIAGALAAGLDACWFNVRRQPADPSITPNWVITELSELGAILGV